jgi:hypothetical protein
MALPEAPMEFFETPSLLDRVIMALIWVVAGALVLGAVAGMAALVQAIL